MQQAPVELFDLKLQDQRLSHVDCIPVQNGFCRPFSPRTAKKMFSAHFIADAFLDDIRYSW